MSSPSSSSDPHESAYLAAKKRAEQLAISSGLRPAPPKVEEVNPAPKSVFRRWQELAFEPLDGQSGAKRAMAAFNFSFALVPFLAIHAVYDTYKVETAARARVHAEEMVGRPIQRPFTPPALNFDLVSAGCRLATTRWIPLSFALCMIYGIEYPIRCAMYKTFLHQAHEAVRSAEGQGKGAQAAHLAQQLKELEKRTPTSSNMISKAGAGAISGLVMAGGLRALRINMGVPWVWWMLPAASACTALGAQVLPDWEKLPKAIGGGGGSAAFR